MVLHDLLSDYFAKTASALRMVHVMSTLVDKGAENCPGRRDLSGHGEEFSATATASLDIALVFASIDDMRFNLAAFLALPAVIDMTPLGASRAVVTLDASYLPPLSGAPPAGAAASSDAENSTILTFVVIMCRP